MSKNFLVGLIILLFAVLFGFLVTRGFSDLNENSKSYTAAAIDMIDQRTDSIFLSINDFPGNAANNILFLSKLSCFKDVADDRDSEFSIHGIENIKKDFLEFIKQSNAYYQLRYIDEDGYEVIRVDFDGENKYQIIPSGNLQDKSWRYYFNQAMSLDEGEVYISPLDLNIEDGKIENRGTEENPVYVPVIRYATPIADSQGNKKGILIANIYADYFLEDIRRFQREEETVFLVNEKGYYLAHPDREKEFAFMLGENNNFYNDYPEAPKEILSDFSKRRVETEDLIFSFRRIYPTVSSFEVHEGSEKIIGENSENRYFWVLASVTEKEEIRKIFESQEKDNLYFLLFSGTIILAIIILIFVLAFKVNPKTKK